MKINFPKCYQAMEMRDGGRDHTENATREYVRQTIRNYVMEYHRQVEEQLQPLFMHYHRTEGATQSKTGSPYLHDKPKPETCDCEGRKKLENAYFIWQEDGGLWVRWVSNGTGYIEDCLLCNKPLP